MRKSASGTTPALVGVIALTGIILSGSPARAADECLAAPNSSAPPGSHWYYHSDRSTQRKCWYVKPEDRQAHAESPKIQPAAKSSAETAAVATGEQINAAGQAERASARPAAVSGNVQTEAPVSERSEAPAVTTSAPSTADEQPASSDKTDLLPMPSPAVVGDPEPAAAAVENSSLASTASFKQNGQDIAAVQGQSTNPDKAVADTSPQPSAYRADDATQSTAGSATFSPIRVALLIPAVLALTGVIVFAALPSRLRNRIHTRRWGSDSDAITAQQKMSPSSNDAIVEPNWPAAQIDMSDELKRNLRAVLQTLEAQIRGDVELDEALAQRRSSKPAWG